jgi:hypothetical protein
VVFFDLASLINMNALPFTHPIEIEMLNLEATMTLDSDVLIVYMLQISTFTKNLLDILKK